MTYLLLGPDAKLKQEKISELRAQILTSPEARQFDYEVLYTAKLDADTLTKSFLNLPAVAKRRLIIIYGGHDLKAREQEILLNFIRSKHEHCVLVVESEDWTPEDPFVGKVKNVVKIFASAPEIKENVFAMTRAMERRQESQAVQVLHQLFTQGEHPLQIMGGLVWFWGKTRARLSLERFEEGLLALQEADMNIKRSRLDPYYAMEVVVVKLCSILKLT